MIIILCLIILLCFKKAIRFHEWEENFYGSYLFHLASYSGKKLLKFPILSPATLAKLSAHRRDKPAYIGRKETNDMEI